MNNIIVEVRKALKFVGIYPEQIFSVDAPQLYKVYVNLGSAKDHKKLKSNQLIISRKLRLEEKELIIKNSRKADVELIIPKVEKRILPFCDIPKTEKLTECNFGIDTDNNPVNFDLDEKHLLVAGASGSGKSVLLNNIICSLLQKNNSKTMKFVMIDPKKVELMKYDGMPMQMCPVVTNPRDAIQRLKQIINLMHERYKVMEQYGVKKLSELHWEFGRMINIVVVIDEVATLMEQSKKEAEELIITIAQLGRACGVSLILCTQNPKVQYISGNIKANLTNRIALKVGDITASKNILDYSGAERLTGKGDALFKCEQQVEPIRFQSAWIDTRQIEDIISQTR